MKTLQLNSLHFKVSITERGYQYYNLVLTKEQAPAFCLNTITTMVEAVQDC